MRLIVALVIVFFLGIPFMYSQGEGVYLIDVEVDTSLVAGMTYSECQSRNFPELKSSPIVHETLQMSSGHDELPEGYQPSRIHLKGDLTYLFIWKDREILVALCEYIELDDSELLQKSIDLKKVTFSSVIQPNQESLSNRENRSSDFSNHPFPVAISNLKLSEELSEIDSLLEYSRSGTQVSYIFTDEFSQFDIIQYNPKGSNRSHKLKVIKYWVYSDLVLAYRYKNHWFDSEFIPYKTIKSFKDSDPIKQRQIDGWKKGYVIIAESEDPRLEKLASKWLDLFKFKAFGQFSCMVPNTVIPSKEALKSELDTRSARSVSSSKNQQEALSIHFFSGATIYQIRTLVESCRVYAVNPIEGTVNNLHYLPEVYFLPDYLKVKRINNQSLSDFALTHCK